MMLVGRSLSLPILFDPEQNSLYGDCLDILHSKDRITKFGMVTDALCCFCAGMQSRKHLFLSPPLLIKSGTRCCNGFKLITFPRPVMERLAGFWVSLR